MKGTKEDPLSIQDLKEYLAQKEGKPLYHEIELKDLYVYKNIKGLKLSCIYVLFEGETYKVSGSQTVKGGITELSLFDPNGNRKRKTVPDTTKFERIYYKRYLSLDDFQTPLEYCGKYHYSEGGGWYSKRQIYGVDGKYYADLTP